MTMVLTLASGSCPEMTECLEKCVCVRGKFTTGEEGDEKRETKETERNCGHHRPESQSHYSQLALNCVLLKPICAASACRGASENPALSA